MTATLGRGRLAGVRARRMLLVTLVAVAGCGRGGCGSTREPGTHPIAGGPPQRGGTVVVAIPAEPKSLMPYAPLAQGTPASDILVLLFPYLIATEPDLVSYAPQLAQSWEWEPDGKSLVFHLRADARWEDGVPVTAEDVRFSYEVSRDTLVGWPTMRWKREIEACEVLDPQTVRFRFSRVPREAVRFAKEGFVIPKHLLEGVPRDGWAASDFAKHPIGCGPFRIESWEPAQRVVLVRSDTYWDPELPYLDRVVFRIVPDAATRVRLLRAGELDFVDELTARDAKTIRAEGTAVQILTCKGRDYDYIAYNLRDSLFASPRVREALTRALDREGIVSSLLQGFAEPLDGPVVPILWAHDPDLPRVPYDPDGARRLLSEAGWIDRDGDGWLDRDGRRLEFTVLLVNDNERRREVIVAVQSQWKQVGVKADIQMLERGTLGERRVKGLFETLYAGWGTNVAMELEPIWGCGGRNNFIGYCNPRVDSLIEAAVDLKYERAKPLLFEAQRRVAADAPYIFMYSVFNIVGTSSRLRNVKVDARGTLLNPESWWVVDAAAGAR